MPIQKFILAIICSLTAAPLLADVSYGRYSRSQARFIAEHTSFDPDVGTRIGLEIVSDPEWHTYWTNPGDSGAAPILDFTSDAAIEFGDAAYPVPTRIDVGPLTTFGYEGKVLLIADVKPVSTPLKDEFIDIKLDAEWLVCKVECIPAFAEFTIRLPVEQHNTTTKTNDLFAAFTESWPQLLPDGVKLWAQSEPSELIIEGANFTAVDFFPAYGAGLQLKRPAKLDKGVAQILSLPKSDAAAEAATGINGLLLASEGNTTTGYMIDVPYSKKTPSMSLATMLLFAFIGGLILNLMPCVLPVVGIKVLGLTKLAQAAPARARLLMGSYVAGVVVSFLALAGVLLGLQMSGSAIGWGFQLQSPKFILGMFVLFFLIGANFLGWFAIHWMPQWDPGKTAQPNSVTYEFLTGVLAVLVATPCTAPFMGAAIGAALALGAAQSLAVFAALGLGMASPYLLLMITPKAARLVPKPGAWMEIFRQSLAFPMFATAIWLLWVMASQIGDSAWLLGLSVALGLGICMWLRTWLPKTALVLGLACIGAALFVPVSQTTTANPSTSSAIDWLPFSPAAVEQAVAEAPVFIDFTATWCITCQVNKKVTFYAPETLDFISENNIKMVQADWTNHDPVITKYLERYERAGVPMYLFYAKGNMTPILLPEVLTPSIFMSRISDHINQSL